MLSLLEIRQSFSLVTPFLPKEDKPMTLYTSVGTQPLSYRRLVRARRDTYFPHTERECVERNDGTAGCVTD